MMSDFPFGIWTFSYHACNFDLIKICLMLFSETTQVGEGGATWLLPVEAEVHVLHWPL